MWVATTAALVDLFYRNLMPSRMSLPTKRWAMIPASSSCWATVRSGQLTTQWSAAPQLKHFFLPDLLAIILPSVSFLPGIGWGLRSKDFLAEATDGVDVGVEPPAFPFWAKATLPPPPPAGRGWDDDLNFGLPVVEPCRKCGGLCLSL